MNTEIEPPEKQNRVLEMSGDLYKQIQDWVFSDNKEQAGLIFGKKTDEVVEALSFIADESFVREATDMYADYDLEAQLAAMAKNTKPNSNDVVIMMHTHPSIKHFCDFSFRDIASHDALRGLVEGDVEPKSLIKVNNLSPDIDFSPLHGIELMHGVATRANIDIDYRNAREIVDELPKVDIVVDGKVMKAPGFQFNPLLLVPEILQNFASTIIYRIKQANTKLQNFLNANQEQQR